MFADVDCFWLLSWILRKTVGREILRLVCGVRHSLGGARGLGVVIPDFEWHYFSLSLCYLDSPRTSSVMPLPDPDTAYSLRSQTNKQVS